MNMSTWLKEKRVDFALKIFTFFIFPVISFFYSFIRANTRSSYFVFSGMAILFGLSFTVSSGRKFNSIGFDGEYYRQLFESYISVTPYEFIQILKEYITFTSNKKDIYFDIVAFLVSRVTDNYHILFMIFAIVFSYFCLKSLKFLTQESNYTLSISSLILTYLFLDNSLFNINAMRFWTTAWIAVYCIFQILVNKNKKFYFLMFLTPLFHGSFYMFILVFILAKTLKRFEKMWILLFFISFLFSSLSLVLLEFFSSNMNSYLPSNILNLLDTYTSTDYLDEYTDTAEAPSLIMQILKMGVIAYTAIIVLIFTRHSSQIRNNPKTKELYLFLLVWLTIFNFLSFIPSLGGRFLSISFPIMSYIWLINIKDTKYNIIIMMLPIFFLYRIYVMGLYYSKVLEPSFFYSSPFVIIYKYLI